MGAKEENHQGLSGSSSTAESRLSEGAGLNLVLSLLHSTVLIPGLAGWKMT